MRKYNEKIQRETRNGKEKRRITLIKMTPVKQHNFCYLCTTRYKDFEEHVKSMLHLSMMQRNKPIYAEIDNVFEQLKLVNNAEILPSEESTKSDSYDLLKCEEKYEQNQESDSEEIRETTEQRNFKIKEKSSKDNEKTEGRIVKMRKIEAENEEKTEGVDDILRCEEKLKFYE